MSGTQTDIGFRESDGIDRTGFEKVAPADYNRNHGRRPDSPTKGGPRSTPGTYSHPKSTTTADFA